MSALRACGVALAAVAVATAMGVGLKALAPSPALGFLLFIPPILVTALYGGFWPGVAATALGGLSVEYFFYQPYFSSHWAGEDLYPLVVYALTGLGASMLAGRLSQAQADVQRREREFETLFRLTPVGIGIANDPRVQEHQRQPGVCRDAGREHGCQRVVVGARGGTTGVRHPEGRPAGRRRMTCRCKRPPAWGSR